MPEELDSVTARLVTELAEEMLPALSNEITKTLNNRIHVEDFINAIDKTNMISQDLRNQIERAIKSSIDEGRASRNLIVQLLKNSASEISQLRKILDGLPENLNETLKKIPDENNSPEILNELAKISELLNELIQGIQNFSQVYAADHTRKTGGDSDSDSILESQALNENNNLLNNLINNSLPGLEGLVKAHEKAQSHELKEFSKEIASLHDQNYLALVHEIKSAVIQEQEKNAEEIREALLESIEARYKKISLFLKITAGISAAALILSAINIFM